MLKKIALILFIFAMTIFYGGCMNLRIETDVDYPADLFKQTLKKIEKIHALPLHKRGPAANLNILVYDGKDRQLVSFSVPSKVVQEALTEGNFDFGKDKEIEKFSKEIGTVDWKKLGKLEQLGPGLLVEVEVLEDMVHVLIWLD